MWGFGHLLAYAVRDKRLSSGAFAAAFLAVGWTLASQWSEIRPHISVEPGTVVVAVILNGLGLSFVGISWGLLFGGSNRAKHIIKFLAIQPAKHVPGGVAHLSGQVLLTRHATGSVGASAAIVLVHSFSLLLGALTSGAIAFGLARSWLGSGVCVVGVLVSLALGAFGLQMVRSRSAGGSSRWAGLLDRLQDAVPSHRALLAVVIAAAVGVGGLGASFAYVAADAGLPWPFGMAAFVLAWGAGFLAVPFPAGLGIREGVLVLLLGGTIGASAVLAAALLQRVAQVIAELGLALVSLVLDRAL